MTSRRQIIANRRNAQKSTGPRTTAGKLLTGETVITVFENASEYQIFKKRIIRAYKPRSVIEHELAMRLSSLLWRLRRATAIETGLFHIQGQIIEEVHAERLRKAQNLC